MPRRGPVGSFLTYLPQAALLAIARVLPYPARLRFGSCITRGLVAFVPNLRNRVQGNLALIFPQMPQPERDRLRLAMSDSFGRTFIEILTIRAFQRRAAWSEPRGPGWEALLAARAASRGVILVSGHFGQWEAVRGALKARGIECAALYRPVKNPWLERIYLSNLEASGQPIFPRGGPGLRGMVRHLRQGGVIAILLDQYTRHGVMIDFLGHPAPTGTMIADLARKYDVPMIPAYGTRQPDGIRVEIDFEAPIPATGAVSMTQAAANSLAARVRAHPEQYYWLHRRWVKRF